MRVMGDTAFVVEYDRMPCLLEAWADPRRIVVTVDAGSILLQDVVVDAVEHEVPMSPVTR